MDWDEVEACLQHPNQRTVIGPELDCLYIAGGD
jgi:hypothetical protein